MLQEGKELPAVTVEMLGQALVGLVGSGQGKETVEAALQSPFGYGQTVGGDFSIVPAIPEPQGVLQESLDLARESYGAGCGHFEQLPAAPDEVSEALLMERFDQVVVGCPTVVTDDPRVLRGEDFLDHVRSAAVADQVDGDLLRHEGPQPTQDPTNPPTRLVGIDDRALSHNEEKPLVQIAAACCCPQYDLGGPSPRQRDPEGYFEKPCDLAIGDADFVLELDYQGLGARTQLRSCCTQGLGGLKGMSALNSPAATHAVADVDVEFAPDHRAGDLGLELLLKLQELDLPPATGAAVGQRRIVDLVDPSRPLSECFSPILEPRLAARFLRIGYGVSLRERSRLALQLPLKGLDESPEVVVFLPESLVFLLEATESLQKLVRRRPLPFFSGHQPMISAGPVTSFSPIPPDPLNKYGAS
jgi:hypothetical protein